MPRVQVRDAKHVYAIVAAAALAALLIAGCGSSDRADDAAAAPAPDPSEFPAPDGRTLEEIAAAAGPESDLVVSPAGQVFHEGENRMGFGVFTIEREQVDDAEVALYAARPNKPAQGPFTAAVERLDPSAAFRSETSSLDPDAATVVYTAEVELPARGEWRLLALVKDGEQLSYTPVPSAVVGQFPKVPQEGETAPKIDTVTAEEAGGDLASIDTRQPPSSMHETDYKDAYGNEPIVLLFATPALCSSRVCGPVVDIAEEVKSERPDAAAYILQEIYRENLVDKGLRPQVEAFNLPSEPWLFVIDDEGKISTAIEGAFSERELNEALDAVSG